MVFPDLGDELSLERAAELSLEVSGPFAAALEAEGPDNLVLRAARALGALAGGGRGARLRLTKNLPVTAGIKDPGGTFVFVAELAETEGEAYVRRRRVTLGELSESGIEIAEGLTVGDRVITAGISVIHEPSLLLESEHAVRRESPRYRR